MSFENLGLGPILLNAIKKQGYEQATPIQSQSIPKVLEGKDILAGAQTGTGKTAAFSLPLIQRLSEKSQKGKHPNVLIITPTRELAAQILECVEKYSRGLNIRSAVIFGGVKINPQITQLRMGVDILIATPGRLLDHVGQQTLNLSQVETLVLDEADRMLDMGFVHDIKKIIKLVPEKRQNLLFSATYSDEIKSMADKILVEPELIEVASRNTTAETVNQIMHPVTRSRKRELLSKLIKDGKWQQVLVFTRTKHGANRLARQLSKDGIASAAIHGDKSQGQRTTALANFKNGKLRVLVATDIAARGIDISLLPHVVNFDLPQIAESYVHRIGRTGRAGANGLAISLVCPEDHKELKGIHKLIGREIPSQLVEGFEKVEKTEVITRQPRNNNNNSEAKPKKKSSWKNGRKVENGEQRKQSNRRRLNKTSNSNSSSKKVARA